MVLGPVSMQLVKPTPILTRWCSSVQPSEMLESLSPASKFGTTKTRALMLLPSSRLAQSPRLENTTNFPISDILTETRVHLTVSQAPLQVIRILNGNTQTELS